MGALAVDLGTLVLALVALYARPTVVLGVVVGAIMLIPAPLIAPHLHTQYATVDHVVIAAAGLRVVAMLRQGTMTREHFRATPLHLAMALLVATWAVAGIVFSPPTELSNVAEQRMVGLGFAIGFFVIALALLRQLDQPWFVLRLLTLTLAASAAIALVEHISGHAYGHWLFTTAGHPGQTDAAHVLETRAGHYRVRSSAEFALAYSWLGVMLLPIAIVTVLRFRRWFRYGVPIIGIVILAIYWTYSRSAAAAVPVALLLLGLMVRDRRTLMIGGLAVLAAALLYTADPTIHHHLSLSTDSGSVGIRFQRLPPILAAVVHHPYLGLGFGGLQSAAVTTTDNFYLSAYGETGVVGAAVLVALCLTALAQTARGITVRDPVRRSLIGASVVGFIAFLASGAFDDALLISQPVQIAFLLLAVATATAEPELGYALLPRWSTPRAVFLTCIGALAGVVAFLVAPTVVAQQREFNTVSPLGLAASGGLGVGPALIGTVCDVAKAIEPTLPSTHISCRDDYTGPGVGTLRVESPSATETLAAYAKLATALRQVYYFGTDDTYFASPDGPPVKSRATAWNTAPASGAVLGLALAFIAPLPIRRRRPLGSLPEPVHFESGATAAEPPTSASVSAPPPSPPEPAAAVPESSPVEEPVAVPLPPRRRGGTGSLRRPVPVMTPTLPPAILLPEPGETPPPRPTRPPRPTPAEPEPVSERGPRPHIPSLD